jgi:formiminoglutamase
LLFSIGGSNDQSYQNIRALMELNPDKKFGVINIDQHFDVRPLKDGKAHSGSPFRQMLSH